MSLRSQVAIVGVGDSQIGNIPEMTGLGLAAEAALEAVADAGMTKEEIDGLLTGYSFSEPYFMLGTVMAEYLGLQPRYAASLVVGGATAGVMIHHAAAAIAAGSCSAVLILLGENRRSGQSSDESVAALTAVGHPSYENPFGPPVPALYALVARRHMEDWGTTPEQLASVAVTGRYHASMNPNAQMQDLITVEDVLSSRMIADPLHLLDCCLISDAGGALVVTSAERAAQLDKPVVYVRGIGEKHTHEHITMASDLCMSGARNSGDAAYSMAGLGPADMDLAELYDCFTITPILAMEELRLVERGSAGKFFESGEAMIGGLLPVNTHGGMLSQCHAGAVGGLMEFVEATRQLRGEAQQRQVSGARHALVHVEGGVLSSHCTVILSREP